MRLFAAALGVALFVSAAPAAAQTTSRPGPWALDVRGVTSPVPDDLSLYPPLDSTALVPDRGFGVDVGVHVYLFNLGPSRVGVGASALRARATTSPRAATSSDSDSTPPSPPQSVQLDMRVLAPQVSFNFGTREGWSYLSAGLGMTEVTTRTGNVTPSRRESGRLTSLNFGGGARWFLKSHLAFTFDVRMHRVAAGSTGTPGMMILAVGAGFTVR